jgi:hypothetical protein
MTLVTFEIGLPEDFQSELAVDNSDSTK